MTGSWYLGAMLLVAGTFLDGTLSDVFLVLVPLLMLTRPIAVMGRVIADTAFPADITQFEAAPGRARRD